MQDRYLCCPPTFSLAQQCPPHFFILESPLLKPKVTPLPGGSVEPRLENTGVDCSLKDLVRYSFLGHSGHMAELT